MDKKRLLVVVLMLAAVAAFFVFDLKQYFTQAFFESQRARIDAFYTAHPLQTVAVYLVAYVAITALSLPGAVPMTLVGGALFGFWLGTLLVSFASTIGATLAFLASRLVLRDWVQKRFGERLAAVNAGIEKEGAFYLFALRLVPIFPFFLINLLMGLTRIGTFTFYWVSQVGMLLGTMVYVYAGTQLGQFRLSVGLLLAFALIGLLPLVARRFLDALKARQVYAKWPRPGVLRLQHGRHRRRLGRAGLRLHRRGDQGEGGAGRTSPHGRRLPQHRLRAQQGADPLRQAAVAHRAGEGVRHRAGRRAVRLRGRDGTGRATGARHRAPRLGRALPALWASTASRARRRSPPRGPSKCRRPRGRAR